MEHVGGILGAVFVTFERRKQKCPRSPRLEPARAGSTFSSSKSDDKSEKKRLKTLVFQKEASGAHFSWSGVALGRPNGAPRGYDCHRPDTKSPKVGGVGPPYKSTTWGLRGSEAKKRSY